MLAYRMECQGDWTKEWFYAEVICKEREDFKHIVMSPLKISFDLKRPNYRMNGDAKKNYGAFNIMVGRIGTRDLIQEFLAYKVFPTQTGWKLPKVPKVSKAKKGRKDEGDDKLVTLPFKFKEQASFKAPSEWLIFIESRCNEIVGDYLVMEDEAMTSAFGT
jgi:hypothetical protein